MHESPHDAAARDGPDEHKLPPHEIHNLHVAIDYIQSALTEPVPSEARFHLEAARTVIEAHLDAH